MDNKELRSGKERRVADRRKRVDPYYKGPERRFIPDRRTQNDRRKRD